MAEARHFWVAAACIVVLYAGGCSLEKADGDASRKCSYVRAEVTISTCVQGSVSSESFVVHNRDEVCRLAAYFPGLGNGANSSQAASWVPSVRIGFIKTNGEANSVATNYEFWSEGHGDWPVNAGLEAYLREIKLRQSPQGRRVPDKRPVLISHQ